MYGGSTHSRWPQKNSELEHNTNSWSGGQLYVKPLNNKTMAKKVKKQRSDKPQGKSKYARKLQLRNRGILSKTSPFRVVYDRQSESEK